MRLPTLPIEFDSGYSPLPEVRRAGGVNPARIYLAGLASPRSRPVIRSYLRVMAGIINPGADIMTFPWWLVRAEHIRVIRAALIEHYESPSSINSALIALRGVMKIAFQQRRLSADEYLLLRQVPNYKGVSVSKRPLLSRADIGRLLATCPDSPSGVRNAALIAVMYGAGLRRRECVTLRPADWRDGSLLVNGKGGRQRWAFPMPGAGETLDRWMAMRHNSGEWLFQRIIKTGRVLDTALCGEGVATILRHLGWSAGLNGQPVSPHDLRRAYCTHLLEAGVDLFMAQRLMGHASVETTRIYDLRNESAARTASAAITLPGS